MMPAGMLSSIVILIVAFNAMYVVCEELLVFVIKEITVQLNIPDGLAAVTLVALANAAPDTTVNFIGALHIQDAPLTLSSILGSALIAFGIIPPLCILFGRSMSPPAFAVPMPFPAANINDIATDNDSSNNSKSSASSSVVTRKVSESSPLLSSPQLASTTAADSRMVGRSTGSDRASSLYRSPLAAQRYESVTDQNLLDPEQGLPKMEAGELGADLCPQSDELLSSSKKVKQRPLTGRVIAWADDGQKKEDIRGQLKSGIQPAEGGNVGAGVGVDQGAGGVASSALGGSIETRPPSLRSHDALPDLSSSKGNRVNSRSIKAEAMGEQDSEDEEEEELGSGSGAQMLKPYSIIHHCALYLLGLFLFLMDVQDGKIYTSEAWLLISVYVLYVGTHIAFYSKRVSLSTMSDNGDLSPDSRVRTTHTSNAVAQHSLTRAAETATSMTSTRSLLWQKVGPWRVVFQLAGCFSQRDRPAVDLPHHRQQQQHGHHHHQHHRQDHHKLEPEQQQQQRPSHSSVDERTLGYGTATTTSALADKDREREREREWQRVEREREELKRDWAEIGYNPRPPSASCGQLTSHNPTTAQTALQTAQTTIQVDQQRSDQEASSEHPRSRSRSRTRTLSSAVPFTAEAVEAVNETYTIVATGMSYCNETAGCKLAWELLLTANVFFWVVPWLIVRIILFLIVSLPLSRSSDSVASSAEAAAAAAVAASSGEFSRGGGGSYRGISRPVTSTGSSSSEGNSSSSTKGSMSARGIGGASGGSRPLDDHRFSSSLSYSRSPAHSHSKSQTQPQAHAQPRVAHTHARDPEAEAIVTGIWYAWDLLVVFVLGVGGLVLISSIVVSHLEWMIDRLQISGSVVGAIPLAIANELPDTLTALLLTRRSRLDLAISGVLSSQVVNITLAVGLPALVVSIRKHGYQLILHPQNLKVLALLVMLEIALFLSVSIPWGVTLREGFRFPKYVPVWRGGAMLQLLVGCAVYAIFLHASAAGGISPLDH